MLLLFEGNIKHASSRIRGYNWLKYLHGEKKCVVYKRYYGDGLFNRVINFINKRIYYLYLVKSLFCDRILYIQRLNLLPFIIDTFFDKHRIIYDFDDAIYLQRKEYPYFYYFIRRADVICISSNNLLKGIPKEYHDKVVELPSCVDADLIPVSGNYHSDSFNIIWIGSDETFKYLYNIINEIVKFLDSNNNSYLYILSGINTMNFENKHSKIIIHKWTLQDEFNILKLGNVGLMPLFNDEWCAGKAAYKLLLYQAAGLPGLASPVGLNSRIITDYNNGFLCHEDSDWSKYLTILYENRDLARIMGLNGRSIISQHYTYTENLIKFRSLFAN